MNVCGDWRLDREIGRGAYGVVYIATNGKGERAAVKVCRREEGGEERYARELRGAKLYSAIPPQEGLVRMRELAEEPWGFYAVMDLADNEFVKDEPYRPKTLASVISGEKALPLGECIKLGTALAKGLATLQRHHLLHRDIKPGNVIYVGGRPVLTDPGLVVEEDKAASLVGTQGYVPPEKNFTNAASDIYSLGLTLKAASFGRHVEDLDKGPVPEADTRARFFPEWHRILNKATDEDHDRRYQSAKALLKELELLRRKTTIASIAGSRIVKAAIALSALVLVAIMVYFVISSERAKKDLARRSEENKSLTDYIGRQSAEIKSLKDDIVNQAAEIKPLREDVVRQSEENRSLKEDLDRRAAENKSLADNFARQSEEIRLLKADFTKQTADIKPLTEDLDRRSAENEALKIDLARQSEEISSLKRDLLRQPDKVKSLQAALDRQSEENKTLKADLAKQAEEIKSLREDLVSRSIGTNTQNVAMQSVEVEQLRKEVAQLRKVKVASDEQAKKAAQDAWEAVLRNAYRETFEGISEEKLSSMVKEGRKKIFGEKK
ncbi:MAG: protein kinase [Kiritimatiellae bacterium]|nr:protein kinase [Kiritimatiellia bacterium]